VGSVIGVVLVALGAIWLWRKRRRTHHLDRVEGPGAVMTARQGMPEELGGRLGYFGHELSEMLSGRMRDG
jgi:LPXTG-motif cell wall-anchored protein